MLEYRGAMILAPMVRVGTLPTRLLALEYGADIVYTEEIIDFKLIRCKRTVNEILGTIDYVDDDHNIILRTCEREKSKLVVQIGTCDPDRALAAAKLVQQDVSAVDINMGCPKHFSIIGGMGAALLTKPDTVKAILTNLVNNLTVQVTCKIRVLPDEQETLKLAKMIESTGVAAIAVHGRTKPERPQHRNRNEQIRLLASNLKIPVIANGGSGQISKHSDIESFRQDTGAAAVMVARAAEKNCSIFLRRDEPLPLDDVIRDYLRLAIDYDNCFPNTKYCIQQVLGSLQTESVRGRKLLASQQMSDICDIWGLRDYWDNKRAKMMAKSKITEDLKKEEVENIPEDRAKKMKTEDGKAIINGQGILKPNETRSSVIYLRSMFSDKGSDLPKAILSQHILMRGDKQPPTYTTHTLEKHFYSSVELSDGIFTNTFLQKNKRMAEQGAALVACLHLGLISKENFKDCINEGNLQQIAI